MRDPPPQRHRQRILVVSPRVPPRRQADGLDVLAEADWRVQGEHGHVVVEPVGLEVRVRLVVQDAELLAVVVGVEAVPLADADSELGRAEPKISRYVISMEIE